MCCNKKIDLTKLPFFDIYTTKEYSEVNITGGEPLSYPNGVDYLCIMLKELKHDIKIYLYTALTENWYNQHFNLLHIIDGLTITIHDQEAAEEFVILEKKLREYTNGYKDLSMSLKELQWNIQKGISLKIISLGWKIVQFLQMKFL
jgi:hypothetical protein